MAEPLSHRDTDWNQIRAHGGIQHSLLSVGVIEALGVLLTDTTHCPPSYFAVMVRGKREKDRVVFVKLSVIRRKPSRFGGSTYLFEHHGRRMIGRASLGSGTPHPMPSAGMPARTLPGTPSRPRR